MNYLDYFQKNKDGFTRFIKVLKDKYESTGTFKGFVKINNITQIEKNTFERFFGTNFEVGSDIKISLSTFNKVIEKSKFKDFNLVNLITSFLNIDNLKTNKEIKLEKENDYKQYLNNILNKLNNNYLKNIICFNINNKNIISSLLKKKYNKGTLEKELINIDILLNNIPNKPTSLPLYASLTGNPHFLDLNSSSNTLFFHILSEIKKFKLTCNEDKWNLLAELNVYNDTISNYVITFNLIGENIIEEFNNKFGALILNMDNINNISSITGLNNKIFIFENPSILNYFKTKKASIIITSGMPNLAFYKLIDKIDKKTQIYYNGDFDPEGLLIADKVKNYFPYIKLFCYEKEDYVNTQANKPISKSRLNKLVNIKNNELETIKSILLNKKMAGYQENNIKRIEQFFTQLKK